MTDTLTSEERERLEQMLHELENSEHRVVAVPAGDPKHSGHKVRVAEYQNAAWYRRYNQEYQNARGKMKRARTFIHKRKTLIALKRMLAGNLKGVYAERLLAFTRRELANEVLRREAELRVESGEYMPF